METCHHVRPITMNGISHFGDQSVWKPLTMDISHHGHQSPWTSVTMETGHHGEQSNIISIIIRMPVFQLPVRFVPEAPPREPWFSQCHESGPPAGTSLEENIEQQSHGSQARWSGLGATRWRLSDGTSHCICLAHRNSSLT